MKIPRKAWLSGAVALMLLLTFAWPVLIPYEPLPKIDLATLRFVPIWSANFGWTHPGWLVAEILAGMVVTGVATVSMAPPRR